MMISILRPAPTNCNATFELVLKCNLLDRRQNCATTSRTYCANKKSSKSHRCCVARLLLKECSSVSAQWALNDEESRTRGEIGQCWIRFTLSQWRKRAS